MLERRRTIPREIKLYPFIFRKWFIKEKIGQIKNKKENGHGASNNP